MLCLDLTRGYGDHSPLTRPKVSSSPARSTIQCAPGATSGKLFLWAVFGGPGAPAPLGERQGTLGPVPVRFGRDLPTAGGLARGSS